MFSSCLKSIFIFLRKTGASLNFKIELGSLHISPGSYYISGVPQSRTLVGSKKLSCHKFGIIEKLVLLIFHMAWENI
jgi:hypothetical protein